MKDKSEKWADELKTFHEKLKAVAEELKKVISAGVKPEILVYAGPADLSLIFNLRNKLPVHILLFYLFSGNNETGQEDLYSRYPSASMTLFSEIELFASDKVSILINALPGFKVSLSVDENIRVEYREMVDAVNNAIRESVSNNVFMERNRLVHLRSSIFNLPLIEKNSGIGIKKVPEETLALVCGAGPSIASQFDLIKKYEGKICVIAVGHLLEPLARAGITADFVVDVDPLCHYVWDEKLKPDCVFAAATEVSPLIARRFEKILWFSSLQSTSAPILKYAGLKTADLYISQSSSLSALDLAVKSGFKKIALIGQDLSVNVSGKQYMTRPMAEKTEEDVLTEVPGKDGKTVLSPPEFLEIKGSFEKYIRIIEEREDIFEVPQIFNCTARGVKIENIPDIELEKFLESAPEKQAESWINESTPDKKAEIPWKLAERILIERKELSQKISEKAETLYRAVLNSVPDMNLIGKLQDELKRLLVEDAGQNNEDIEIKRFCIFPLIEFADSALASMPPDRNGDPRMELQRIALKHSLLAGLLAEFAEDFRNSYSTDWKFPGPDEIFSFSSLKDFAVRCLRIQNPEFASITEDGIFSDWKHNFEVKLNHEGFPLVHMINPDGSKTSLGPFQLMTAKANREIENFCTEMNFDPEKHAVLFVAPGNWAHVVSFSEKFPLAYMAIIEPWPELFSKLIEVSLFLNKIPPDTVIIPADEKFDDWEKRLAFKAEDWKKSGKKIFTFTSPHCMKIGEIIQLRKKIENLIFQ